MSGRITAVDTARGGQQPVPVCGCTIATYWHITPTLPVTTALVSHVRPLPFTASLSCMCALGTYEPSYTVVPTASSFTLEAHGP
jgi:hypothetical protein